MQGLALLILLILIFWFWYSGAQAKETAIRNVRVACKETGMQLLDSTIFLRKIWPARVKSGRVALLRFYQFEYTERGAERFRGLIVMKGNQVEYLQMEKDGHTIVTTDHHSR